MQKTSLTPATQPTIANAPANASEQNKKISTNYFFRDVPCKISIDPQYEKYICSNHHLMQNPVQCEKGHLSCYECSVVVPQPNGQIKKACPECYLLQSQGASNLPNECFKLHKDLWTKRAINSIEISCPTKDTFDINDQECTWHGNLIKLESHLITDCKIFPKNEILREKISEIEAQLKEIIAKMPNIVDIKDRMDVQDQEIAGLTQEFHLQKQKIEQLEQKVSNTQECATSAASLSSTNVNSKALAEFTWKIDNFSQKLKDIQAGISPASIISPSFSSGQAGYHFVTKVFLNGDGLGKHTHLSAFIAIKKGEFDNILQWPLKNTKITFTLLNQYDRDDDYNDKFFGDPNSSSFKKPENNFNKAIGSPIFIENNQLHNYGFIKDDTIFLKTKVEITSS